MNTTKEQALLDALSVMMALEPHSQSGWETDTFNRALDLAKARVLAALSNYLGDNEPCDPQ